MVRSIAISCSVAQLSVREDRSYMNICFVLNDEYTELQDEFFKFATEGGMVGIKGHRDLVVSVQAARMR